MSLVSAGAALALAVVVTGTGWEDRALLLVPLVLWAGAWVSRGLARDLFLVAAPAAIAVAAPISAPLDWRVIPALLMLGLALVPLTRALGPGRPHARIGLVVAAALVLPVAFFLTPPGAVLAASDLATGALIVAMAAGLLVASVVARALPQA